MGSSLQSTPDSIMYRTLEEVFNFVGGHNIHDFSTPEVDPRSQVLQWTRYKYYLVCLARVSVSLFFCVQGLKCHLFFPRFTSNYPTRKSKC